MSKAVRMLIDPGSELSFIREDLVQDLQLKRSSASIKLRGISGTYAGTTKGLANVNLCSIHDNSTSYRLSAYILPKLTCRLPSIEITKDCWPHLEGLQLADPKFGQPQNVYLILGADSYGDILKPDIIRGGPSTPIAQSTIFGWIVSGLTNIVTQDELQGYHCSVDNDLQNLLEKFWHQEEITSSKIETLTPDEAKCEEHFRSTTSRDESGRYIVRLPLISAATALGDSSKKALRCLTRLTQKFQKDSLYKQLYFDFLNEYLYLNHMELVKDDELECQPTFYLPHRGVYREHVETTKLRVVFNGSSCAENGVSLNNILHSGAKLQTDIFDVLLWFRRHRFVFSTDIIKMYRQIRVHKDDWNLQRIYWLDKEEQVKAYRLKTVTYGLNCAPFLALRVIQQLIEDEGTLFPQAIPTLKKGRYVDDIFGGAESKKEALEIITQLKQLCMAGGFPLQKWHSNSEEIIPQLSNSTDERNGAIELDAHQVKVLGLCWIPRADNFQFNSWPFPNRIITKRTILSEIAQMYDPLGMIAPVVIRAKMLIQDLWLIKVGWDEPLSENIQSSWNTFRQQLPVISSIKIARWIHLSPSVKHIELHGFCDASQFAMAAVVYTRVISESGSIAITFVCAKTKVAPLKRLTIPRLELSAAVLAARLISKVKNSLELTQCSSYIWTDSSVTLHWISSHPSRWKDFVRNRVSTIQEIVPTASWGFVKGKENPADCASRGIKAEDLEHHPLWWTGPSWLTQTSENWPKAIPTATSDNDVEERSKRILTVMLNSTPHYWHLLDRYSSLKKLLRITALCQRAIIKFRDRTALPLDSPLTPVDLNKSRQFWLRTIQKHHFIKEIAMITKGEPLSKSDPLIRLTPFIDREGLLRVGGRLQNTSQDPEFKHPFIIPRHSHFTTLIIADAHAQTLHGGTQITLSYIRQTYWIIGGRAPVRSYILRCVRCARYRRTRAQQLMGQLPATRVNPSRPFLNTGIDYAGPILLKTWRGRAAKQYKGYIAIFVCFSTSATHIEIVTDYTTDAFLAAYKRFTGRRGICATINSDCGTNFIGADVELRKMFNAASAECAEIGNRLATIGTEWKFIPPASPHFGGKWEAAVKSTKHHLRRVIGDSILTYEELTTLTTQIEAILNSRPLCPLSEDSDDFSALTPGHFIIGEALTSIPEPSLLEVPMGRLSRWQLIRQKVELFWKRWTAECLQRYQSISKWHHPSTEVKEGSLVLVMDERSSPTKWPLARVEKLHPGADGLSRVVTLRTSTACLKRPLTKLCILIPDPDKEGFGNSVPEGGRKNVE